MKNKKTLRYLVNGKWVSEKEYLALSDEEYEKIVKQRKKIIK